MQFIKTSSFYTTDTYKDNAGRTLPQEPYYKYELNPYAEYGLRDNLTVGASTFVHAVSQQSATSNDSYNYGLADTELFTRTRLYKDDTYVLSVQPLIKLPSVYRHSGMPRSGTTFWDGEAALQGGAHATLFGYPSFLEADIGYRVRGGSPGDQLKTNLALGIEINDRITLLPKLAGTWRLDHHTAAAFTETGDNDFNLVRGEVSALYKLREDVVLQAGGFAHLYAKNTGLGGGAMVGLWKYF